MGEKSYKLIADAEAGLSETRPMPIPLEDAMLKSPLHFLLYVATCRPIVPGDFVTQHFNLESINQALEDLCRVELVEFRDGTYVQTEPNVSYISSSSGGLRKRFDSLREMHRICQQVWTKNMENKEYRARRFNHFNVSYLTNAQVREILELFWRAYEKLKVFEKENTAAHYSADKYQLWNIHMMLMTPFEG